MITTETILAAAGYIAVGLLGAAFVLAVLFLGAFCISRGDSISEKEARAQEAERDLRQQEYEAERDYNDPTKGLH